MRLPVLALAAVTLMAAPAVAAEQSVPVTSRTGLAVTLYGGGFGLVKDRRHAMLARGANTLAFEGVSPKMVPSSALLRAGPGVRVREQNFDFDILSPKTLLDRSVGKTVHVITTQPATGEEKVEAATVLAARDGVVLRIGNRIETGVPGRLVFDRVPAGLHAEPTLRFDVDSAKAGAMPLELTYLSGGLGWRADYVAELDAAGTHIGLDAWASLSNTTGVAFEGADVQLVAGDVPREARRPVAAFKASAMAEAVPALAAVNQEAMGDVHLYTLPRKVTLAGNQTKQVALLSAPAVPVTRQYILDRWISAAAGSATGTPTIHRPAIYLSFRNTKEAGLGVPLPAGLVRVYQRDSRGQVQFTGERSIGAAAPGERVTLHLGQAVDIGVQYEQTAFTTDGLPPNAFESAHRITVSNAKAEAVTVRLVERFPGAAKILKESRPHGAFSGAEAVWNVDVPAGGKAILSYRVRVQRAR